MAKPTKTTEAPPTTEPKKAFDFADLTVISGLCLGLSGIAEFPFWSRVGALAVAFICMALYLSFRSIWPAWLRVVATFATLCIGTWFGVQLVEHRESGPPNVSVEPFYTIVNPLNGLEQLNAPVHNNGDSPALDFRLVGLTQESNAIDTQNENLLFSQLYGNMGTQQGTTLDPHKGGVLSIELPNSDGFRTEYARGRVGLYVVELVRYKDSAGHVYTVERCSFSRAPSLPLNCETHNTGP